MSFGRICSVIIGFIWIVIKFGTYIVDDGAPSLLPYYFFNVIGNGFINSYFGMPGYEDTREKFCCEQLHLLVLADFPNFVI